MAVDLNSGVHPVVSGRRAIVWVGRRGESLEVGGLPRWKRVVYTCCRAGFETILVVTDSRAERLREELEDDPRLEGRNLAVIPSDASWFTALRPVEGRWVVVWDEWIVSESLLVELAESDGAPVAASSLGPFAADGSDLQAFARQGWQPSHPPIDTIRCELARPRLYVRVVTGADVPHAEEELFRSLVPAGANWFARSVVRPMSHVITRRLMDLPIRPNHITVSSAAVGIIGALVLLEGSWISGVVGTLLFLFSTIVDGCDGELARLRFQETRLGGRLDFFLDNVVHVCLFPAIALRCATGDERGLYVSLAVISAVGLVFVVLGIWWIVLRQAPSPTVKTVFSWFQNREFAYVLVVLAVFDRFEWFAWAAAVGTWSFPFVLYGLSAWDRFRTPSY